MSSSRENLEKFLAVETAGGPKFHPKEPRIAFVYNGSGVYQVYTTTIKEGSALWPSRVTREEDRCTDPRYLSDGSIVFTRDHGGNENFQIGCIDTDGHISWVSTDLGAKHLIQYTTKKHLYFTANIEDKASMDTYRVKIPIIENEYERIYSPGEGVCLPQSVSPSEKKLVVNRYYGNNDQELVLVNLENLESYSLTESLSKERTTRWKSLRWLDENHLLVITDYESDLRRICSLSTDSKFQTIPEIEDKFQFEIESATWNDDYDLTYFIGNEEGYNRLYRGKFSLGSVVDLEEIALPLEGVVPSGDSRSFQSAMSLSSDGRYLAITLASATSPTNIWILDIENRKSWKTTEVNTVGLNKDSFVGASLHRFKSFDGLSVPYFKYTPHGEMPSTGWPAILIIHGGPESQIRPDFSPRTQFFLSGGFAVITPNIRGSTGYGRTYMDMDNIDKRLDSIKDIKHLALYLKDSDPEIDGERLVVFGGSYGGFAVLSAMTEHPDLWKAGVDIVGISSFVTFLRNTADWRRKLREVEYGSLDRHLDILESISPINKVDQISAPLFIIQGDNDERVPLSESLQIYEQVKSNGVPVELLRFADEGHGMAKMHNRIEAYTRVLEWLKEIV